MDITESTRKAAHNLADSIKDTVKELEQIRKESAETENAKGSLFDEFSRINDYLINSRQNSSDDDFVTDVAIFAKMQIEAAKIIFEDPRNEATKILSKSKYWESAKTYFYVTALNYIGYIAENYQAFVYMLEVTNEALPEYIDEMLKDLVDNAKNEDQPVSELELSYYLAVFATLVDGCKAKGLEPTKANLLKYNSEITDAANKAKHANVKEEYRNIKLSTIKNILMPIDKINNELTKIDASKEKEQTFLFDVGKKKKQNATVLLSVDFTELAKNCPEVERLSEFDKTVMNVIGSISYYGYNVTTTGQVAKMLRRTTNAKFNKKIAESLSCMTAIQTSIDNEEAAKRLGYDRLIYKGSMLPIERVTAIVNGQVVEDAIHIFRMPPLVEYALKCGQVITIPADFYSNTAISNSKYSLPLKNYLLRRIKQKNADEYDKILLKTIWKECEIEDERGQRRSVETIKTLLEELKDRGELYDYEIKKEYVKLTISEPQNKQ